MLNVVTGIKTDISGAIVESVSIQGSFLLDMYEYFRESGQSYANNSSGFTGGSYLTLPRLTTTCNPSDKSSTMDADAIVVVEPDGSSLDKNLSIKLGGNGGKNFSGATYSLSFDQVIFPISF